MSGSGSGAKPNVGSWRNADQLIPYCAAMASA